MDRERIIISQSIKVSSRNVRKAIILMLLSSLFIGLASCAAGSIGADPTHGSNICLSGLFSDGEVSMIITGNAGALAMSGWKETGHDVPWETLSFTGVVLRDGSALVDFTLHFPAETVSPTEISIPDTIVPDTRLVLSDGVSCEVRNDLSFSLVYESTDGLSRGDLTGRVLTRQP